MIYLHKLFMQCMHTFRTTKLCICISWVVVQALKLHSKHYITSFRIPMYNCITRLPTFLAAFLGKSWTLNSVKLMFYLLQKHWLSWLRHIGIWENCCQSNNSLDNSLEIFTASICCCSILSSIVRDPSAISSDCAASLAKGVWPLVLQRICERSEKVLICFNC